MHMLRSVLFAMSLALICCGQDIWSYSPWGSIRWGLWNDWDMEPPMMIPHMHHHRHKQHRHGNKNRNSHSEERQDRPKLSKYTGNQYASMYGLSNTYPGSNEPNPPPSGSNFGKMPIDNRPNLPEPFDNPPFFGQGTMNMPPQMPTSSRNNNPIGPENMQPSFPSQNNGQTPPPQIPTPPSIPDPPSGPGFEPNAQPFFPDQNNRNLPPQIPTPPSIPDPLIGIGPNSQPSVLSQNNGKISPPIPTPPTIPDPPSGPIEPPRSNLGSNIENLFQPSDLSAQPRGPPSAAV